MISRLFIFIILLGLCSCQTQKPRNNQHCDKETRKYYYCSYSGSSFDDNIIELNFKGDSLTSGYFWGTSDESDVGREGYYPGFLVMQMKELRTIGDSIFFSLDSREEIYFSAPIPVSIHSSEEALDAGFHRWRQEASYFQDSIPYKGSLVNDTIVLKDHHGWVDLSTRTFIPLSLDSIQKRERSIDPKSELLNRQGYEPEEEEL